MALVWRWYEAAMELLPAVSFALSGTMRHDRAYSGIKRHERDGCLEGLLQVCNLALKQLIFFS